MTTVEIWGARAGQTQSRLFEEIRQCREAGQRVLLLVPEQYTLQAERELVEQLNLPGLLDLDVLSPRRLGRRIRESAGHSPKAALNESGRRMALAQALLQMPEEAQTCIPYYPYAGVRGLCALHVSSPQAAVRAYSELWQLSLTSWQQAYARIKQLDTAK